MRFYILDDETILCEFQEEETSHPYFNQCLAKVRNICHCKKDNETEYIITLKDKTPEESPTIQLGEVLDPIRECYMCDVLPESDPEKNVSGCPVFKFTPHPNDLENENVVKKDLGEVKK